MRILPDFIIIGAQRSGTTSLFNYINRHPHVSSTHKKEVHFFDYNYSRNLYWYRAHFAPKIYKYFNHRFRKKIIVTGEATPYYIFHPLIPERIAKHLPDVKLIAILRNPIDRAYSHYWHNIYNGWENLQFHQSIQSEPQRLEGEYNNFIKNQNYNSYDYQRYSYLSRGIYVNQIKRWLEFFPRGQMLVLQSEPFFREPAKILDLVFEFLKLPNFRVSKYNVYRVGNYPPMDPEMRGKLVRIFKPHNKKLYDLLGYNLNWDL